MKKAMPNGKWNSAATTEPEEEGLYFVSSPFDSLNAKWYSYWDGKIWRSRSKSIEHAMKDFTESVVMRMPDAKWCGAL